MTSKPSRYKARVVPCSLIAASAISYLLWQHQPYSNLFPHLTISEYLPRKYYAHAMLLAPINFQTQGHLLVYGPAMLYSFYLASQVLTNHQFLALYLVNSLASAAITVYYERKKNMQF